MTLMKWGVKNGSRTFHSRNAVRNV
ncbi:hypothetical protein CCACVL1_01417, partial [Corchorus capsularis]